MISKTARPYLVLFLAALAVRVLHVLFMRGSPFFDHPVVDSRTYVEIALRIIAGKGPGGGVFWQPPLYPYFLAGLLAVSGNLLVPRLAQALLGALNCVLLCRLGEAAWPGARTGRIAGWLAAFYGPLVFFDGELLVPVLVVSLDLLALLWFQSRAAASPARSWVVPGLLLGLSAIARPTVLALLPLLLLWILFVLEGPQVGGRRARGVRALLLLLGVSLVVGPVTAHNRLAGGDWVLVSYNGGINFFIGNNPHYDETVAMRPGYRWEELTSLADEAGARRPAERSAVYVERARRFIAGDPVAWLRLMGRKLLLFLNGYEIPRNVDIYFLRGYSPILALLLWDALLRFPFGLVLPFGVLGLLAPGGRGRALAPLYIFLLGTTATVLAFFVTGRYRLPAAVVLLLFAVRGASALREEARVWRRGRVAVRAGLLVALLVVANLPLGTGARSLRGEAFYFLGTVELEKGEKRAARESFGRAAELDPRNAEAWNNLGNLRQEAGELEAAGEAYGRALAADPDHVSTLVNLAALRLRTGRIEEAIRQATRALEIEPTNWRGHLFLSLAFEAAGRPEEARRHKELAESLGAPARGP